MAAAPLTTVMWCQRVMRFASIALRSSGIKSKVLMFAYNGRPEHLADTPITREQFTEDFYAITKRLDIKFGSTTWLSNWRIVSVLPLANSLTRTLDRTCAWWTRCAAGAFSSPEAPISLTPLLTNPSTSDAAHCHSPTGGQGLNSSVQDVINLGWKLALVHRGHAAPALLDSHSAERFRVIAQMVKLTTELYHKTFSVTDDEGWRRGGDLTMLDCVCESGKRAHARCSSCAGRVGPRSRREDAVFGASAHIVLLFGGDSAAHAGVAEVLARFPAGTVRTVQIVPQGQTASDSGGPALVVEDREGHAYTGYGVPADNLTVVVVRPDGVR
ncbi:FAD binding domain-containing protein [Mycena polygramma]|nr:FAD binding domain-containing protein [Mycena polygramma]